MRRFTDLFIALDRTTRTSVKTVAIAEYVRSAPPEDAAVAIGLLLGQRGRRPVKTRDLRQWITEATSLPSWLVDECHAAVGDLSETLSLLLPEPDGSIDHPLHRFVAERITALGGRNSTEQRSSVMQTWRELDRDERFVFHKLIGGGFRVGVSARLVTRALADVAGVDAAVMAHRLTGTWRPTAAHLRAVLSSDALQSDVASPYPFFLASPLQQEVTALGSIAEWHAEWKWDGIRAQVLRRDGRTLVWSRGEEMIGGSFPELVDVGDALPDGTVIDGEVLAWSDGRPMDFTMLQRRIGRKGVVPMLFPDVPIVLMAFDLLEFEGRDLRNDPLSARRAALNAVVESVDHENLLMSRRLEADAWARLAAWQEASREHGAEGLILKRVGSPYRVGRARGDWWKWKVDPYTIDAVLIYAFPGSGKRASLYTDYAFGVWDGDALVPVCRAYSGLTDEEIRAVDRHVRRTTLERKGPVRIVEPQLVFEIGFEALQPSTRHRSGIALRFPRMLRWRTDKRPVDADRIETLHDLLARHRGADRS